MKQKYLLVHDMGCDYEIETHVTRFDSSEEMLNYVNNTKHFSNFHVQFMGRIAEEFELNPVETVTKYELKNK